MSVNEWYKWQNDKLILKLHVQPGAKSEGFAGTHGDCIRLRIRARAHDGKANNALIKLLAEQFAVARSQVTIERGQGSRNKTVCIHGPIRLPDLPGLAARKA